MNKLILSIGLIGGILIATTVNLYGQDSPLKYGARLGVSVSYFGETPKFEGGDPGLVAGAYVQYQIIPLLNAGAEILFHQQRGQGASEITIDPSFIKHTTNSITLQTIEIPVMVGLDLPEIGGLSLGIKAGYSYSYIMSASEHQVNDYYMPDGFQFSTGGRENTTSGYLRYQHAFVGSAGLSLPVSSPIIKSLSIDFRYRLGISPIENSYGVLQGRAANLSSQSLQFVLGFQL